MRRFDSVHKALAVYQLIPKTSFIKNHLLSIRAA
uniref:Uncharacterized protein n=1 Tax=Enterococcus phage PMBT56 TaxID=3229530 RepID=A0AB39C6G5_9CAUD